MRGAERRERNLVDGSSVAASCLVHGRVARARACFTMLFTGPVTRIIDPLFLSLCLVLLLPKFRAAKTASLDVSSEARYSPRKFMQNTHLMLVSDLSKLLGLIAVVWNDRSLSFSSFTVS